MPTKRKKIAVVVPKYGLVGGGEQFVSQLTEIMANNPIYDIHVFANRWQLISENITFHKVPIISFPKWFTTISFAWYVSKAIEAIGDFDIIHTHERIFKADVCSMHFIPHRIWIKEIRRKRLLSLFDLATIWVEKKMLSDSGGCRYVLPVSSLAMEKLLEEYPAYEDKTKIIPPGVAESYSPNSLQVSNDIRTEFDISGSDFLILFVSMNFELKGLDQLLMAMGQIQNESSDKTFKILVVGRGNTKKYMAMATSLSIRKRVYFAGVRHDMEKIYRAGDVFVLLSDFDTFGMVVTEAMASSLPVIVSNKVGAKDMVKNGNNGFVIDKNDLVQLKKHLNCLYDNPKLKLSMGECAKNTCQDETWDHTAREIAGIYASF